MKIIFGIFIVCFMIGLIFGGSEKKRAKEADWLNEYDRKNPL